MFNPFDEGADETSENHVFDLICKLEKKNENTRLRVLDELEKSEIKNAHLNMLLCKLNKNKNDSNDLLEDKMNRIYDKIIREWPVDVFNEMKEIGDSRFNTMCLRNRISTKKVIKLLAADKVANHMFVINNSVDLGVLQLFVQYQVEQNATILNKLNIQFEYKLTTNDFKALHYVIKNVDKNSLIARVIYEYLMEMNGMFNIKIYMLLDQFSDEITDYDRIQKEVEEHSRDLSNKTLELIFKCNKIVKDNIQVESYEKCKVLGKEKDDQYLIRVFGDDFDVFEMMQGRKNEFYVELLKNKKSEIVKSVNKHFQSVIECDVDNTILDEMKEMEISNVAKLHILFKLGEKKPLELTNQEIQTYFRCAQKVLNSSRIVEFLEQTRRHDLDVTEFINENQELANLECMKHFKISFRELRLTSFHATKELFEQKYDQSEIAFGEYRSNNTLLAALCYCNITKDDLKSIWNRIDFMFIFNHFCSKRLLLKLVQLAPSYGRIITHIASHIGQLDIQNSIYFTGGVFDSDEFFYKNTLVLPYRDKRVEIIRDVLKMILDQESDLISAKLLHSLCCLLLFDEFTEMFDLDSTITSPLELLLGKNGIFLNRITRHPNQINSKLSQIGFQYKTNKKALDVAIRNGSIQVFGLTDPTFLSDEAVSLISRHIINATEFDTHCFVDGNCTVFNSLLESIKMIDGDRMLLTEFRHRRLAAYSSLITAISKLASNLMIDNWSFSKQEQHTDHDFLRQFLTDWISEYTNAYFTILLHTLHRISNLILISFIEECIPNKAVSDFTNYATPSEMTLFCYLFPRRFRRLSQPSLSITSLISLIRSRRLPDGVTLSVVPSHTVTEFRYSYEVDSIKDGVTFRLFSDVSRPPVCDSQIRLNILLQKSYNLTEIFNTWKVNYDKKLVGFTECLICYFIIDPEYKRAPDYECSNCGNKFHRSCIFRWIGQARSEKCPMCRVELN
ncbi:LTN1 [Enterospora canceri]|uniref:E3 ubiquitin-protein ligase listerin n=1 Tax=Enterospora canceri TaxID=1081671 RepID=A0A1Y1S986_9MICR|nr:LTN1 [Enterospora canceri]